jgi:hypothetical protein
VRNPFGCSVLAEHDGRAIKLHIECAFDADKNVFVLALTDIENRARGQDGLLGTSWVT